ncbi:MAG: ribosome-binding factor A, partial [Polyangiaceae bacterium]|nr:ribosome-binding factor A [Polyangiaceae bacterium]
MAREEVKRSVRVAERIRAELMEMILRGDVHDPGIDGVLVSAVRVSDDLGYARIYLRRLE